MSRSFDFRVYMHVRLLLVLIASLWLACGCGGGSGSNAGSAGSGGDSAPLSAAALYGTKSALAISGAAHAEDAAASGGGPVRYVRLEAVSEINGHPWSSMAEFNLLDAAGATIPRAGWSVVADSTETVGENGAAQRAIDGDPNTFWHTRWSGGNPAPPHTFTVDLGTPQTISAFKMLPRPGGGNGTISGWRFYESADGSNWTLVAQGTFASTADEKTVVIANVAQPVAPVALTGATRVVRLVALSEVNGNPWTSVAEFNLLDSNGTLIPRTGWSASADSAETVGENAPASRAIDGDPGSFWHTQWYGGHPAGPHVLTVALGAGRSVGGFRYLPRQTGVNGRIANFRFDTSEDGSAWTLAAQGTFTNDATEKTVLSSTLAAIEPDLPPPGASGSNPPIVFNATTSAAAGDVVSLQGENFGGAPTVYLESSPAVALEIVNRVATGWLAVRVPAGAAGALVLRIANGSGISAAVKLNAATPLHLDAMQLVPGGAFRVYGRNLLWPGATPRVTIDGAVATLDLTRSDATMLSATAPAGLAATGAASVVVDNGNGTGPAALDRTIDVVTVQSGDPFGLGVGWAAGYAAISGRIVDTATDARLSKKMACNGRQDDAPAVQAAIDLAATGGGGVVKLPAGRCRLAGGLSLRSRVVLQGAGTASTELVYESDYPVTGVGLDLVGIADLTLTNAGSASEGPLLKNSTRVFLQNLRVRLMTSRQMYFSGNRNMVVAGSSFEQSGSISQQGPYTFYGSAGLVFEGNRTLWVDGAPNFARLHDSVVRANQFTRDASTQRVGSGVVHSFVMDFGSRIDVVGNTFDVANGPVTNTERNDGETILTEGGGAARTENLGSVAGAGARTLSDPANTLQTDPFGEGVVPENYGVAIVGGKGAGQTRRVVAYTQPTLTVDRDWDSVPDATSRYATFVWGLEKSLIKGNHLAQNPRGIWLYHTAVRDVDVIANDISEGGGIYLRAYQNLSTKSFMPIYNVLIANNSVTNTGGHWGSYINSVFVNADARAFGIASIGIEMRANRLAANLPNLSMPGEEYAGSEGYVNMMRVEKYDAYESSVVPRVLGSILNGNTCTNCDVALRIGTGVGGMTDLNMTRIGSGAALQDSAATANRTEKSTDTVVR